ncbi:histidinol phosphate phosphatase [Haloimpatiens sp. FM7315]|uniref:histidinol phosphate phosphatase n=1 Tax=Haloimpatiens sp. FM7315 TaxID=3298609 RepID=UPI0035A2A600
MFDTHMHTKFSTDSKMIINDAVNFANKLKLGVTITEHMDLKFPIKDKFVFDVGEYFNKYDKYRKQGVLLGVELGMRMDCIEENRELQKENDFDYVIGSLHLVRNIDVYEEALYKGRAKKEVYEEYLKAMLQCVEVYDFVDSIGHIDYISRYARYDDTELYYEDYKYLIDEILEKIIENEKVIELNTRRLGNEKSQKELKKIYKRYYELGGRYITLGSDAHTEVNIGRNFDIALGMARDCNLKIVHFEKRKLIVD